MRLAPIKPAGSRGKKGSARNLFDSVSRPQNRNSGLISVGSSDCGVRLNTYADSIEPGRASS